MLYKKVLHKAFSRIPDMTAKEVDPAVDSVIHENEHNLKNATKDMATKADFAKMETRMVAKISGLVLAIVVIVIAGAALILHYYLPSGLSWSRIFS